MHDGAGLPRRVIAKVKRASGLNRAATAFLAVHLAASKRRSDAPTVPQLLRLDPPRHVLYLEELPGVPLNVAIGTLDLTAALEHLGALHRALQELEVGGITARRTIGDWLQTARVAATQIGLFVPSSAGRAEEVYAELVRTAPADGRLLFCQGDFLPGQILCHPTGWSVIDFDDSRYADPLSDVAAMYAALPRELGLPPEQAERARRTYLQAYASRAGEPVRRGPLALVPRAAPARRARQAADEGPGRPRGDTDGARAALAPRRRQPLVTPLSVRAASRRRRAGSAPPRGPAATRACAGGGAGSSG